MFPAPLIWAMLDCAARYKFTYDMCVCMYVMVCRRYLAYTVVVNCPCCCSFILIRPMFQLPAGHRTDENVLMFCFLCYFTPVCLCCCGCTLQCFDAVGWAAGRAFVRPVKVLLQQIPKVAFERWPVKSTVVVVVVIVVVVVVAAAASWKVAVKWLFVFVSFWHELT